MSKNLIPQIAQMLGVEIGEKFKVKGDDELTYKFTNNGLVLIQTDGFGLELELADVAAKVALCSLLNGKDEIVKIPWKPKNGEDYYTFGCVSGKWEAIQQTWTNHPFDLALINKEWIYRTKEEAEAALPAVAAEMGVEYEL